ncbi:MAG: hypothetical protein CL424_03155 [Acidimicrobiaceae bacterium]|nr:hypothetical protein [Acidimicrobiaceae bacterium]
MTNTTSSGTRPTVRLSPGSGFVARRGSALLFVPDADDELVAAFSAALAGSELDAVTAHADTVRANAHDATVDAGTDGPVRFVAIGWSDRLRLVVSGDVEVTTDHPSLPRLSARGAGTWVERTLDASAYAASSHDGEPGVTVAAGDEIDAVTDLVEGVVRSGGFQVRIVTADQGARPEPATLPTPVTDASPVEPSVAGPAEPDEQDEQDEPSVDSAGSTSTAPPERSDDPSTVAERVASEVLGSFSGPGDRFAAGPDDVTIVPDLPPSPPPVSPESSGTPEPVPSQPSTTRWRLEFADGAVEAIDRTLVLGRSPTRRDGETEQGTRLVRLDCPQVSSRHLAATADGDGVTLVDLGSSNGSFVLTTGDGRLVQLEPGVPHRVGAGTIVQIGTRRFTVTDVP